MAVPFPIGSIVFLLRKKHKLLDEDFYSSYGTLYGNLRTFKKSNEWNLYWVPLYMVKRLLVAIITVFASQLNWLQIILFQIVQLI